MPAAQDFNHGKEQEAAQRRPKSLQLRIEGNTYRQIAEQLGISVTTAYEDVRESLDELAAEKKAKATDLRGLEEERLDLLWQKVKAKLDDGDVSAIAVAVRLIERRARLLGLDAPERKELGNVPGQVYKTHIVDAGDEDV